jgi:hypothetical protein
MTTNLNQQRSHASKSFSIFLDYSLQTIMARQLTKFAMWLPMFHSQCEEDPKKHWLLCNAILSMQRKNDMIHLVEYQTNVHERSSWVY